jgi:hypothetical protein
MKTGKHIDRLRSHSILYSLPPEVIDDPTVEAIKKYLTMHLRTVKYIVLVSSLIGLYFIVVGFITYKLNGNGPILFGGFIIIISMIKYLHSHHSVMTDDEIRDMIDPNK